MTYRTRGRQASSERVVSPQRLIHYRSTWYLDAWCHQKDRLLRFALDAVSQAQGLPERAKEVALRTVEAELDGGYGIFAGSKPQWATLVFSAQAAQWVSHEEWHPQQKTRWRDDGSYEMKLPYTNQTELVMDLLRHGAQVRVSGPDSLAEAVQAELKAALRAGSR